MNSRTVLIAACVLALAWPAPVPATGLRVGVARADITPEHPILLSGFAARKKESEGAEQRLWAKAIAFAADVNAPAILITVDNCGLSQAITDEVAVRLERRLKIPRERVAVCSTHTHSAPMVSGVLLNLFVTNIPPASLDTIDRYTRELIDKLERVAAGAVADLQPARVEWGQGSVAFAKNRRVIRNGTAVFGENPAEPVDHTLSLLRVAGTNGGTRALLANYACHCTTLGADMNRCHGDWAGSAQQIIERENTGVTALVNVGCGADANPSPRGRLEHVEAHGRSIANEVRRLLLGPPLLPLTGAPECRSKRIALDFAPLPAREQWEERATKGGIVGFHARKNLARLDRGEALPVALPYFVQTWAFGTNLAMVFLPGEVVVDYQLRLKREFDARRLWVTAYANDVPCYIPSVRILNEGGYEAEDSLWYYDRPARLATNTEDRIIGAVQELTPKAFAHAR
jgi:hypothetical protein